jgi:hypothetical protein
MAVAIASSASATPGSGTTMTITAPSGIATDDLLVCGLVTDGLDTIDPDTGGPSGWTCFPASGNAATQSCTVQLWWKVAVLADESASDYSWTLTSDYYQGHLMRITGADTSNPFERAASADGDSTTVVAPALNPRKDDGMLLTVHGNDRARGTPATPSGMNSEYAVSSGGAGGNGLGVFSLTLTTQYTSTGTKSSSIGATADEWGAISVIVNSDESALTDGSIVVGKFNSPTDGADVVETIGAKAQALLLFTAGKTAAGSSSHVFASYGMAASGSNESASGVCSEDNLSSQSNTNNFTSQTYSIYLYDESETLKLAGSVKTWGATSVTFEWNTYDASNAYDIYYVAFCGDGVDASVINTTEKGSTGTQTYAHGLSAIPTTLFTSSSWDNQVAGIFWGGSMGFGVANDNQVGTTDQGAVAWADENTQATSDAYSTQSTTDFGLVRTPTGAGATSYNCSIDSVDATNVTLAWTTSATSKLFSFLCLSGVRSAITSETVPGSTSGSYDIDHTDSGVDPQAVLAFMTRNSADYVNFALGAGTSSSNRFALSISSDDNVSTTNTLRGQSEVRVLEDMIADATVDLALDIGTLALDTTTVDVENLGASDVTFLCVALETIPYQVSGTDVTCTLETLSFTKYNTSVNAKNQVAGTLETLTFTTYNTTVNVDSNVTCTLETLSLTTYNTTVQADNAVDATLETLSFTAYNASLNVKSQVDTTLETLSLTAYASVVNDQTNVDATLETLSFTSYNASLNVKNQVDTTLETLSFTAYQTSVVVGISVFCTLETLSFTAYNTTIKADNEVDLTLETLTLTPYAASLNVKQQVVSTLETLSFAAYAADIKLNVNVAGTLEQLILTAYPTTVQVISGGFFRNMKGNLDGLGSGGPFFKNPLG